MFVRTSLALTLALAFGCTEAESPPSSTRLTLAPTPSGLAGSFENLAFRADVIGPDHVTARFVFPAAELDVELDRTTGLYTEDAHGQILHRADTEALLALRDALDVEHPELRDTLHGALLVRLADRFAEAPTGLRLDRRATRIPDRRGVTYRPFAGALGCGDDAVTCLPGTSGTTWAVFSDASGTCTPVSRSYGGSSCSGRCGIGCSLFDSDYTWDCFDHDRCIATLGGGVTGDNPACGDEFWDAADDFIATIGPHCSGGSLRPDPVEELVRFSFTGATDEAQVAADGATPRGFAELPVMRRSEALTLVRTANAFNAAGWTTSNAAYFTVTVTPAPGLTVRAVQLRLDEQRSATGPTAFHVRSSLDNFATIRGGGATTTATLGSHAVTLGLTSTQPLELRFYATGAASANGTWRLDNVALDGSAR